MQKTLANTYLQGSGVPEGIARPSLAARACMNPPALIRNDSRTISRCIIVSYYVMKPLYYAVYDVFFLLGSVVLISSF